MPSLLPLIITLTLLAIIPIAIVLVLGKTPPLSEEPQQDSFSVFSMEQASDPDHAIIWDTQLPALQLLASAGPAGMAATNLYAFYMKSCHQYPELYDGSTFESWLEFLQRDHLITIDGGKASLQAEG